MEFDFKFILYIIFFVIYILVKTLKKSKSKQSPKRPRAKIDEETHEVEPTITFEDIFRGVTNDKRKEEPEPVEVINKVEEFESNYPSDDEIQEVYRESLRQAEKNKTLEEIVQDNAKKKKAAIPETKESTPSYVEERFSLASELGEILKNPEDARKAIVLKEILDRKF